MRRWFSLFLNLALPAPQRRSATDSDWIAVATLRLAATLQSLDQLWVVTVGMMAVEVAAGAYAASLAAASQVSRVVWSPIGIGLLVSICLGVVVLFSGRSLVKQAPTYEPRMDLEALITRLESATTNNLAVLRWGWNALSLGLGLAFVGAGMTFVGLQGGSPYGALTEKVIATAALLLGLVGGGLLLQVGRFAYSRLSKL